jgi:hypothetical protein
MTNRFLAFVPAEEYHPKKLQLIAIMSAARSRNRTDEQHAELLGSLSDPQLCEF